jgi:glycosyltransferase involved in cell wall biosynthesis
MTSMRNILAVANYKPDVGYAWWLMERFWVQLAEVARSMGQRTFLAYPEQGTPPEAIRNSPLEVVELPFPTQGRRWQPQLRFLREHQIGGIYFTDRPYLSPSYAAYRSAGVRVIVNHDHTPGDRPPARGPRALAKTLVNRISPIAVDRWVALSQLMEERAVHSGCIPREKIVIVANGIEPLAQDEGARAQWRRELGIAADEVAVVSVGRAHAYKRIDFIIDLLALARQASLPRLRYMHFGDGPDLERLAQRLAHHGLPTAQFQLLGAVPNASQYLPAFDIAVHASHGEGFSLSILECMAAGLALLVTDQPSVSQAVAHDQTALIFPRNDLAAAARLFTSLATDRALRGRLGRAAQEVAQERFPWSRTEREFSDLAHWLCLASCSK